MVWGYLEGCLVYGLVQHEIKMQVVAGSSPFSDGDGSMETWTGFDDVLCSVLVLALSV